MLHINIFLIFNVKRILYRQDKEITIEKFGNEKSELEESGTILNSKIENLQKELEDSTIQITNLRKTMEEKENDFKVNVTYPYFCSNFDVLPSYYRKCFCMVYVQAKLKIFYNVNLQQDLIKQNEFESQRKNDSLMNEINELEALRKTENESLMKLTDDKSESEQKLQEINNQTAKLEKLHNTTLANLEVLKHEKEELENEYLSLKNANNEMQNQIDQKTSDCESLNEKLESSQKEIGYITANIVEKEEITKVVKLICHSFKLFIS